jgi:signal transduction histidine kinase
MKYWLTIGAAFLLALLAAWAPLGGSINNSAYDWMSRLYPVVRTQPEALILAIDESTLRNQGGIRGLRRFLAQLLDRVAAQQPRMVAVDFTLADAGDPAEDAALAAAMKKLNGKLVLAADLARNGTGWEDPLPAFASAARLGHVHAEPDPVCRMISLNKASGRERRWALALETYLAGRTVIETPAGVESGDHRFPYQVMIRYSERLPAVPADQDFDARGKAVFIGATALTAARDRLMTPIGAMMPGVEIHANVYETLREGRFLQPLPGSIELLLAILIAGASGVIFSRIPGWAGYLAALALLALAHAMPHLAWQRDIAMPSFSLLAVAWLTAVTGGAYQYFVTRLRLDHAERDRTRYQQAIHWVTHEMRTPLTAIQGSSELMSRYSLPDAKRREIVDMINMESKRLARMVQTFLDVERLSAGQMELKKDRFSPGDAVTSCVERARQLAERKGIVLETAAQADGSVLGDRELMEYAVYNLVTNAIKYSPQGSVVHISSQAGGSAVRVAVKDQGIGIDARDLKKLGTRFFRTRQAEKSGVEGTGIGLSLVQEIVRHHGGRMEVSSKLGEGSCFVIELPRLDPADPA